MAWTWLPVARYIVVKIILLLVTSYSRHIVWSFTLDVQPWNIGNYFTSACTASVVMIIGESSYLFLSSKKNAL